MAMNHRNANQNALNQDLILPDIVLRKADTAFAAIRKENEEKMNLTPATKKRMFKSGWALAACIALLVLCGATVFAAVNHFWSEGMDHDLLTAGEDQVKNLEENGMLLTSHEGASVTADGITITPLEVVSDGSAAYITFLVTGTGEYVDPETEVLFYDQHFTFDENELLPISAGGRFYDGPVPDENGVSAREYEITVMTFTDDNKDLLGRTIHIELGNLAPVTGKAELGEAFAKGPWTFDLELPSEIRSVKYPKEQALEDSIYVVQSVEVTPISLRIDYSLNGEPEIWREDNNIPMITAVTLKDGTVIDNSDAFSRPMIDGGRRSFYEAEGGSAMAFGLARLGQVIEPDEVAKITLREFSEAIIWGDVPDDIVAQEYGGEIPFERVVPGEEKHWEIILP
ncbi:MAG: DUF4179 domain-containing protein [Parasporobacterium sp.]|nr:DUF4179 domain-containing protein [Parasporobacterium sp.]